MKYRIALYYSDEGYSVSVLGLPGCWSQGSTEEEAIENIKIAISEYNTVVEEQLKGKEMPGRNRKPSGFQFLPKGVVPPL